MFSQNAALLNGNRSNMYELFMPDSLDNMPQFGTQGTIPMDTAMPYQMPELGVATPQGQSGASNVVQQQAAYSSGLHRPPEPSGGQKALSGAATGASIGSAILPGWGTAIGAVAGALFSLF